MSSNSDEEVDFYKILEIDKGASDEEVKRAFRRFSKRFHPDMQHGKSEAEKKAAEEMFKKGQAAYECLSDPEKRKIYDEYGIDGLKGHAQQGGFSGGMPEGLAEFIRKHMRGFGFDPFGGGDDDDGFNPFGHSRSEKHRAPSNLDPEDGQSYRIRMEVDLEDIIFGSEKEFTMDGFDVCPECHGHKCEEYEKCHVCQGQGMVSEIRGNMFFQTTCPTCHGGGYLPKNVCKKCGGEGRVKVKRQIKVKIPKGLPEGGQLRVRGGGVCGINGGKAGDLFILISTKKHPLFARNGELNLVETVYVNPLISVFGGDIEIPTPHGIVKKHLDPGTKNGQVILVHGYGIRKDDSAIAPFGDLYANIVYDTFDSNMLSKEEKEALKSAFKATTSNKKALLNANKQWKEITEKTKLPWAKSVNSENSVS